jgi:pyruvate kinase
VREEPASGVAEALDADIESVRLELARIRANLVGDQASREPLLAAVHANFRESSRNLLHYLSLRRQDLRSLQNRLATLGLSSLGRAEPHVLATVDAVLEILERLASVPARMTVRRSMAHDFASGTRMLAEHTTALLGPPVPGREVRIMVTMPSEAAHEYTLVRDLLQQGMDCMRINCAHDDATAWSRMIDNLRRAERALGRSCRVVMDLAGPKLRTGPVEPGPAVVRIRPQRDTYGRVTAPARVWLTAATSRRTAPSAADASLPVPAEWLAQLAVGASIRFTDARGSKRSMTVVDLTEDGCWAEAVRTAYLTPGMVMRREAGKPARGECEVRIGDLPPREGALSLAAGELLVLTKDTNPGRRATVDSVGRILTPATIGCTIPKVLDEVRPGESIWFDDGKIGGIIENVEANRVVVRITQVNQGGARLRADKGINLPDSKLRLGALTVKDIENLAFIAQHADVVELSFANRTSDVESLQQHLQRLGSRRPGIVLKVETRQAFENLPDMLLTAMRWPSCGVMIARGDLAVECGFERLAEVQEEILWICEAAHIPVVWATQVLESLTKEGMPSRAEITDAAMGHRAECVMLNKGRYVLAAVRVLDGILRRMRAHQAKKRSMLRELVLAHSRLAIPAKSGDPLN